MSTSSDQAASKKLNLERATNFMRQYRDPESRELKKLSANQFMEVWSHYDKDGKITHLRLKYNIYFNSIHLEKKLLKRKMTLSNST